MTVRVTDTGIPPLSDAQTFSVVVSGPPQFTGAAAGTNGRVEIKFNSLPAQIYQVQYKTNLTDPAWAPLGGTIPGAGSTVTVTDNWLEAPQRFYRLLALPH